MKPLDPDIICVESGSGRNGSEVELCPSSVYLCPSSHRSPQRSTMKLFNNTHSKNKDKTKTRREKPIYHFGKEICKVVSKQENDRLPKHPILHLSIL